MKKTPTVFCVAVSLWLHSSLVSAGDGEALVNERFPVDSTLLKKQWNVNCDNTVNLTLSWLTGQKSQVDKSWDQLPWRGLKYCGLLFNTPDTGRYQPCPDFTEAHRQLLVMRQGVEMFNPEQITRALANQCHQ